MTASGDDDVRRVRAERDALMRLCDEQRYKIGRQAAELKRLRARVDRQAATIAALVAVPAGSTCDVGPQSTQSEYDV